MSYSSDSLAAPCMFERYEVVGTRTSWPTKKGYSEFAPNIADRGQSRIATDLITPICCANPSSQHRLCSFLVFVTGGVYDPLYYFLLKNNSIALLSNRAIMWLRQGSVSRTRTVSSLRQWALSGKNKNNNKTRWSCPHIVVGYCSNQNNGLLHKPAGCSKFSTLSSKMSSSLSPFSSIRTTASTWSMRKFSSARPIS